MEAEIQKTTPILNIAWTRTAQLSAYSKARKKTHLRMRRWIAVLAVLATLFAILTESYPANFPQLGSVVLKILLVSTPIVGSILAAFTNRFFSSGDWLIARAGAEEIYKEVYIYRTILQKNPARRAWLEKRLGEIHRQVYRGMGGELVLKPYKGQIPERYNSENPDSDPGFHDLTGDEYFRYRLEDQLAWHTKEVNKNQIQRIRLQWYILISGGMGALLAALGGGFSLWVAFTASLAAAFIGWQELINVDAIIRNYSKVIIELTVIYDHWHNLELEERTTSEFYKMVRSTEGVLWSQNVEYIKAMQEALKEADLEQEAGLINRVIQESVDSDERMKQAMQDNIIDFTQQTLSETEGKADENFKTALGMLAEEASSELVQQELAAMSKAVTETVEAVTVRVPGFASKLEGITKQFSNVEIGRDTPPSTLNAMLAQYPKTGEVKG